MGLMKKLTSVLVASSLVLGSVGMALAAPTEEQVNASAARLAAYDIVKGRLQADGTTDLALGEPITRAELLKVVIMGLGYTEAQVNVLKGAPSFSDVDVNQWYAPYVALAKNIAEQNGFEVGYPDGTFRPNNQVTAIEALVFVMKLLGITPVTGENWIQGNIDLAVQNGVITSADAEALLDAATEPANRGLAFAIVDTAFITYTVDGKNVYQRFVDKEAPGLAVDATPESVQAATITITGTVTGASELYADSDAITFDAEGKFSYEKTLDVGPNTITLTAKDIVGNVTTVDVVVERTVGAAANVAVEIASQIEAGSEAEMKIVVTDATGAAVEVDAESLAVTIGGNIGSYADGVFKASEKAGKGTITVTYGDLEPAVVEVEIVPGPLAKVEAEVATVKPGTSVKLLAKDQFGNVIEGATFASEAENVFIKGDVFTATKAGQYEVTATVGEASVTGTISVFGSAAGLKIEAPETIVGNNSSQIEVKVSVVDDGGNVVSDYNGKIQYVSTNSLTPVGGTLKAAKNGTATFKFKAPYDLVGSDVDIEFVWDQDKDGIIEASETEPADIESFTISVEEQIATSLELKVDEYLPTDGYAKVTVNVLDQLGKPMLDGVWNVTLKVDGPAFFAEPGDVDPDDLDGSLANAETYDELEFAVEYDPSGPDTTTVYLVPEDDDEEGKVTVTATYEGLTSATASLTAAEPGDPAALKLVAEDDDAVTVNDDDDDSYATFSLVVVDKKGVPSKLEDDTTITIDFGEVREDLIWVQTSLETDEPDFDSVTPVDDDKYEFTAPEGTSKVTIWVSYAKAGTLSATASAKGLTKSSTASVDFAAGTPKYVGLTKPALELLDEGNVEATLTAQLFDEFGNKAPKAGYSIVFKSVDYDEDEEKYVDRYDGIALNGSEKKFTATTDDNGQASVKVSLARYVDWAIIQVVDDDNDDLNQGSRIDYDLDSNVFGSVGTFGLGKAYQFAALTVSKTVAKTVSVTVVDPNNNYATLRNVTSGQDIALKVEVKNNFGKPYDVIGDYTNPEVEDWFEIEASDDDAIGDMTLVTSEAEDGIYYIEGFTAKEAGSLTFTVSMVRNTDVKGSRTVSVKAGPADKVAVKEDLVVKNKKPVTFTLEVLDENNNPISRNASEGYQLKIKIVDANDVDLVAGDDYEIRAADGSKVDGDLSDGWYDVEVKKGYNSLKLQLTTYGLSGEYTIVITGDLSGEADFTVE